MEYASPPAKRVYDWQHACVSTRNPARPYRRGAGHSVAFLPKIYAKRIHDQNHVARRRIEGALPGPGESEEDTAHEPEADLSGGLPRPASSR